MNRGKCTLATFIVLMAILVVPQAAIGRHYGKLELASKGSDSMSIGKLQKDWQNYSVYYVGVDISTAYAAVFLPKSAAKSLTGDRWSEVKDQDTVRRLISTIHSRNIAERSARLWKILGPDREVYGYMYSARSWAVIKPENGSLSVNVN
jgi:hypothetical protein